MIIATVVSLGLGIAGSVGGAANAATVKHPASHMNGAVSASASITDGRSPMAPRVIPANNNGQQITFIDDAGLVDRVCLRGTNQGGNVASNCWPTPNYRTNLAGYWWAGTVTITEYDSAGNRYGIEYAHVPMTSGTPWWCFSDVYGDIGACLS